MNRFEMEPEILDEDEIIFELQRRNLMPAGLPQKRDLTRLLRDTLHQEAREKKQAPLAKIVAPEEVEREQKRVEVRLEQVEEFLKDPKQNFSFIKTILIHCEGKLGSLVPGEGLSDRQQAVVNRFMRLKKAFVGNLEVPQKGKVTRPEKMAVPQATSTQSTGTMPKAGEGPGKGEDLGMQESQGDRESVVASSGESDEDTLNDDLSDTRLGELNWRDPGRAARRSEVPPRNVNWREPDPRRERSLYTQQQQTRRSSVRGNDSHRSRDLYDWGRERDQENRYRAPRSRSAVRKWNIRFSADENKDTYSFTQFCRVIETMARSRDFEHEDLLSEAIHLFEDRAKRWFIRNMPYLQTWAELKNRLKRDLLSDRDDNHLRDEANARKQKENEMSAEYIEDLQTIFDAMEEPPEERDMLWIAKRNMLPELRMQLVNSGKVFRSLMQLKEHCREWDVVRKDIERERRASSHRVANPGYQQRRFVNEIEADPDREEFEVDAVMNGGRMRNEGRDWNPTTPPSPWKKTPNRPKFDVKEMECFNCGEKGHFYRFCTKPVQQFCYLCGSKGVLTVQCPQCAPKLGFHNGQ